MEKGKNLICDRLKSIYTVTKHGLFLHGVRNNFARIGVDIMPYYWFTTTLEFIKPQNIKGEELDLKLSVFEKTEINTVKNAIIGIKEKKMLVDLQNGDTCIGFKHGTEIVAYSFIRRKSFNFRNRYFHLDEKDCYFHSTYVFEKYRGKNIAPYLRYKCLSVLEKEDFRCYHSISEYFNKSAIKFQKKLNAKPAHLFLCIRLFKKVTWNFRLKSYTI